MRKSHGWIVNWSDGPAAESPGAAESRIVTAEGHSIHIYIRQEALGLLYVYPVDGGALGGEVLRPCQHFCTHIYYYHCQASRS